MRIIIFIKGGCLRAVHVKGAPAHEDIDVSLFDFDDEDTRAAYYDDAIRDAIPVEF